MTDDSSQSEFYCETHMTLAATLVRSALPALFAVSGIAAALVLPNGSTTQTTAGASVWIDWPTNGTTVQAGIVHVQAHGAGTAKLSLRVDGHDIGSDANPTITNGFAYGRIDWNATTGEHDLVVTSGKATSRTHHITVLGKTTNTAPPTTQSTPTTKTTTPSGSSTTSSSSSSTSSSTSSPPDSSTTTTPHPPRTSTPTPTTTEPMARPTIGTISVSGECTLQVSAPLANATSARTTIAADSIGYDKTVAMTIANHHASATVTINNAATFTVAVIATGPGGVTFKSTTFTNACKP